MNYLEVKFRLHAPEDDNAQLLIAILSQEGYEGFEEQTGFLLAYLPENSFDKTFLAQDSIKKLYLDYQTSVLPEQNWNKVWEENYFQPVEITPDCIIRAEFHQLEKKYTHEILIHPQMSFGTGHHSTTALIARKLFELNLQNTALLDMGSGTGILAILAAKLGATKVLAIDNDEWAYKNSIENIKINNVPDIKISLGDANLLDGSESFDIILSNINLNINIENIPYYAKVAKKGSLLLLSGFYTHDFFAIDAICQKVGYRLREQKEDNNWSLLIYIFEN